VTARAKAPSSATQPLADWERLATDAVGTTIEFWGFKLNHGRVWGLLYLRGRAMDAGEIRQVLGLSKGAVSMVTRELERWGVIHRERTPGESVWRFRAETELKEMISRVLSEREAKMVKRVEANLKEAQRLARSARTGTEAAQKLARLNTLAETVRLAIEAFLATSRLDIRSLTNILVVEAGRRVRSLRSR
jgi:DNA-binding transcriptional regulator GbsR (MarR family)